MSAINEALKKSGQSILTQSESRSSKPKRKTQTLWGATFIVSLLALIAVPVWSSLTPKIISDRLTSGISSPSMRRQFAVEEVPLKSTLHRAPAPLGMRVGNFSLSGLVYSKTGSFCLINGKVMKIGDRIGETMLSQITPDEVVLDTRGEKIILSTNPA